MKTLALFAAVLTLGLTLVVTDAEAAQYEAQGMGALALDQGRTRK